MSRAVDRTTQWMRKGFSPIGLILRCLSVLRLSWLQRRSLDDFIQHEDLHARAPAPRERLVVLDERFIIGRHAQTNAARVDAEGHQPLHGVAAAAIRQVPLVPLGADRYWTASSMSSDFNAL